MPARPRTHGHPHEEPDRAYSNEDQEPDEAPADEAKADEPDPATEEGVTAIADAAPKSWAPGMRIDE